MTWRSCLTWGFAFLWAFFSLAQVALEGMDKESDFRQRLWEERCLTTPRDCDHN